MRAKRVADDEQAARALRWKCSPRMRPLQVDKVEIECGYMTWTGVSRPFALVDIYTRGMRLRSDATAWPVLALMLPLELPRPYGVTLSTTLLDNDGFDFGPCFACDEHQACVLSTDEEPCIDVPAGLRLVAALMPSDAVLRVVLEYHCDIDEHVCERLRTDTRAHLCGASVPTKKQVRDTKTLVYAAALAAHPGVHEASSSIKYMPLDIVEEILRCV